MKTVRIVSLVTLGFLGVTAMMGGIPLMLDPSGGMLHMPLSLLAQTPFHNFLIPGIILLTTNGLSSLAVLVATVQRVRGYAYLVGMQGFVIAGWITVEVIMLHAVVWPHVVYWAVGAVLIVCAWALRRERRAATPAVVAIH
jgi:hypothetical protein